MKKLACFVAFILLIACILVSCDGANSDQNDETKDDLGITEDGSNTKNDDIIKDTDNEHVHAFAEWITVIEPDCINEGLKEHICICGEKESEKISAVGHTIEIIPSIESTCIENGFSQGLFCSVCGVTLASQQELPLTAHTYDDQYDETCNVCEYVRNVECAHRETEILKGYAPTCIETGITYGERCLKCGDTIVVQYYIPALGHSQSDWIIEKEPTAKENGSQYKICLVCGEKIASEILYFTDTQGLTYRINSDKVTCTITGGIDNNIAELIIPESLGPYRVTDISSSAFREYGSLTKVVISDGVTSIGYRAFLGCWQLTDIEIPSSVTSIGDQAFMSCSSLTSVEIPSGVTKIGKSAFSGCSSLCSITLPFVGASPDDTTNWHFGYIFGAYDYRDNDSYVPSTLKTVILTGEYNVAERSFYNCNYLESMTLFSIESNTLPGIFGVSTNVSNIKDILKNLKSITIISGSSISNDAFAYCTNISSIELPDSISSIGEKAFYNCHSLSSIKISDGITSIGKEAFTGCIGITRIHIPGSVTSIGDDAFVCCSSLENITVSEDNLFYKDIEGNIYSKDGTVLVQYAIGKTEEDFVIPKTVTKILVGQFNKCTFLKNISFEESSQLTEIDPWTFYGCKGLTTIQIPDSVVEIGAFAFMDCISLSRVVIPKSVTLIQPGAFHNCNSLESIVLPFVGVKSKYDSGDKIYLKQFGTIFAPQLAVPNLYDVDWYEFVPDSLKTVVITGDYQIEKGAFYGCDSIENISLPFVGRAPNGTTNTHFGYIFGASNYEENADYVPTELKTVTISGEYQIAYGAFYGCDSIENISLPFVGRAPNGTTNTHFGYIFGASNYEENADYIPSGLKSVTISGEYQIVKGAFYGCNSLESLTIPFIGATLNGTENTHLGYIFGADTMYDNLNYVPQSLKTVVISGANTIGKGAFYECESLTKVDILGDVYNIGDYAFYGCILLENIQLPDTVTSIGNRAFGRCESFTTIVVPDSVISMGDSTFYDCISLESITLPFVGAELNGTENNFFAYIFNSAVYAYPKNLTTVVITGGNSIGDMAFYDCRFLTNISIPNTVTSIGNNAFEFCSSLVGIDIPDSVTSVGEDAFRECDNLGYIKIGKGLNEIGLNAFYGCELLKAVYVDDISTWCMIEFNTSDGYLYSHPQNYGAELYVNNEPIPDEIVIPDGVTKIGKFAFYFCENISSVVIPDSVTSIGYDAFENTKLFNDKSNWKDGVLYIDNHLIYAKGLSSSEYVVKDGTITIAAGAFQGCNSLQSVVISDSVKEIGEGAFSYLSLKRVTISKSVTKICDYAFYNCSVLSDVYYTGSEAEWSEIIIEPTNYSLYYARLHCNYVIEE